MALTVPSCSVSYYTSAVLRVSRSVLKHGCTIEDISHAYDMALLDIYIDPDGDPPRFLIIGPNSAGNLLELIGGEFDEQVQQV